MEMLIQALGDQVPTYYMTVLYMYNKNHVLLYTFNSVKYSSTLSRLYVGLKGEER